MTTLCFLATYLFTVGCEAKNEQIVKLDKEFEVPLKLISEGEQGSARIRVRQHMDQQGESAQGFFIMGLSYHNEKRYAKAVEWFDGALSFDGPAYPPTLHFLGWSHYYLGNTTEAKEAFQRFLILQDHEPDSMFALGLIATDEGDEQKALKWFRKTIERCNQQPQLLQNIAAKSYARMSDILESRGNTDEAIAFYLRAIELNPKLYEVYHRLSNIYRRKGDEQLAENAQQQFFATRDIVRPDLRHTSFPE